MLPPSRGRRPVRCRSGCDRRRVDRRHARTGRQGRRHLLRLPRNRGKAAALRAGLEYAQAGGFTHVLTLDGDGQHLPEDIPALLDAGAADLVIGARGFDRAGMPRSRYFSNTMGSKVASWLVVARSATARADSG